MSVVVIFAELIEQHYFHHQLDWLAVCGDINEIQSADQVAALSFPFLYMSDNF